MQDTHGGNDIGDTENEKRGAQKTKLNKSHRRNQQIIKGTAAPIRSETKCKNKRATKRTRTHMMGGGIVYAGGANILPAEDPHRRAIKKARGLLSGKYRMPAADTIGGKPRYALTKVNAPCANAAPRLLA